MKNKWFIASAAVGIHISIGSIYAYSVMINPLKKTLGWDKLSISMAFSIAILFLGLSAAFLGFMINKKGPRFSGLLAAVCYSFGMVGTGLSIQIDSYPLFIIAYGVLGGIGLGLGYITPVTTLMKWFPNKRGLATGIAIMGFGFAALIFGPLMAYLFELTSISTTFYILSIIYFILMTVSSCYLGPPPQNYTSSINKKDISNSTAFEALKTLRFYLVWILLFINISCGLGIISMASPLAQKTTGVDALQAAAIVGLMGLFNGLGRIAWASFSDISGRLFTYTLFFVLQAVAFLFIANIYNVLLFQFFLYLIITCYGGGFATLPAFLGDLFGTKEVGTIHGYILTAWSAAGLAGPTLVSLLYETTGRFSTCMQVFASLFVVALLITFVLWRNITHHSEGK